MSSQTRRLQLVSPRPAPPPQDQAQKAGKKPEPCMVPLPWKCQVCGVEAVAMCDFNAPVRVVTHQLVKFHMEHSPGCQIDGVENQMLLKSSVPTAAPRPKLYLPPAPALIPPG